MIAIRLPFLKQDDFTVKKYGDELVIDVNSRRKSVFLPRFANFLKMSEYAYNDSWLHIKLLKDSK